jgi:hypothetical protein
MSKKEDQVVHCTSNPEYRSSDDASSSRGDTCPNRFATTQSNLAINLQRPQGFQKARLKKGMAEECVLRELYIIEGDEGFESSTARGRLTRVAN